MKKFKKINMYVLFIVFVIGLILAPSCQCCRYKSIFNGTPYSVANKGDLEQIENVLITSLNNRQHDNPELNVPHILVGGSYNSVPHISGYEVHHLISRRFCEEVKKREPQLTINNAPSVSIPIGLHKLTGSYGGKSNEYFEKEKTAYEEGGLTEVLKLGWEDLKNAIEQFYKDDHDVNNYKMGETPMKAILNSLQAKNSYANLNEENLNKKPPETSPYKKRPRISRKFTCESESESESETTGNILFKEECCV